MTQHLRTPILEVRPLTIATVAPGDLLACHTPTGTYPYEVRVIEPDEQVGRSRLTLTEIGHASGLEPLITLVADTDLTVKALPQHFGVCRLCGRLSPCPDELDERCLERLFDTPATAVQSGPTPPPTPAAADRGAPATRAEDHHRSDATTTTGHHAEHRPTPQHSPRRSRHGQAIGPALS